MLSQSIQRNSPINFVKNYDFAYPQLRAHVTFTCVAGHLMHAEFDSAHRPWASCDPFQLFDAPIERFIEKDKKGIASNLEREARGAQKLIIWTDCDREGEAIGKEISDICRKVNPRIVVKRARFSAVIAAQIHNAMQHPVELDLAQAAAVDARILLDLRIGAAFTRMQSKALWGQVAQCNEKLISYGPCQFPTLGFVVARFNQVRSFVAEEFYYIHLALTRPDDATHEDVETTFTWRRGHLFDREVALAIYEGVLDDTHARVIEVKKKDVKKWKPLPLTTVELQKSGSRLLKLSPKKILDIAEKLYQDGFLSYPRTETDQYDPAFDFKTLIEKQTADANWGGFAAQLNNIPGKFAPPRRGKHNDNAHPPIHPTAHAANLTGDNARVYAFVTRRFLGSCSLDALGHETSVKVEYGGEEFTASGLVVLERNYLDVYIYDKWEGKRVPEFREGETFVPTVCELKIGETTSPKYLTEADLVGLMDKNGIGTDATIADHIAKVIDREYVVQKIEGGTTYLLPSRLGMGLVDGYNSIDFDRSLSKPQLRRMTERSMVEVCEGTKTKHDMLNESIEQYQDMYVRAQANFARVVDNVRRYLDAPAAGAGGNARGGRGGGRGARGGRGGRGGGGGAGRGNGGGGSDNDNDDFGGGDPAPARGRGRGRARARAAAPASRGRAAPPPPPPPAPAPAPAPIVVVDDDDEDYWAAIDDMDTQPAAAPKPPNAAARKPLSAIAPKPPPVAAPKSSSTIKPLSTYNPPAASYANQNAQASSSRLPPPPPPDAGENPIYCMCGNPARILSVVKEGDNKGRGFWRCARPRDGPEPQCDFFQWADEDGPKGGSGGGGRSTGGGGGGGSAATVPAKRRFGDASAPGGRRCDCDLTAVRKTTQKEGPNKGRDFWACPSSQSAKCGFFEWADEPAGAWAGDPTGGGGGGAAGMGGTGGGGGGEGRAGGCFKCGQEGHWSNACPNAPTGGAGAGRSQGGGGTQTGTCFKCGEEGHWSNACPNPDAGGGGGFKRSKTMPSASGASASAECFKCHQTGHYSRDCPNEGESGGSGRGRGRGKARGTARSGSGSFPKRGRGRGKGTGRGKSKSSGAGKFGSMEDFYF
ncbi:unnamed protein product [Peniophora sp. CBMAI 1063]|nr:unnamed protein product [Peniophora sp. CBMAI 1063]